MDKKEAISIITSCAKTFEEELCGNNVLFVYKHNGQINVFETCFMQQNFLHLTGIRYCGSSKNFFRECRERKLATDSITLEKDGTTELKLRVLPQLVRINKTARMIGQYDNSKTLLVTHKLVGGVCGCIGFIQDGPFYIPNTALNEDIRDISKKPCGRILATFTKERDQSLYQKTTYTAKDIDISSILAQNCIKGIVVV